MGYSVRIELTSNNLLLIILSEVSKMCASDFSLKIGFTVWTKFIQPTHTGLV